ncbi:MAG TPA: hypothetical protein PL110_01975 [Candidatus Eremiobacteraeota bacterium]|nr:MAG: hypothetical protein BWY64_02272 [bacterium ADurb.Bin363]HPZ06858.1 hypothetical protein [Candidatus Eremiobacteraeota bacterium]
MKKSKFIVSLTLIVFFSATLCFIMSYHGKTIAQEMENGKDIKKQFHLMQSLYLINSLKLTSEQVKSLLPVLEEARTLSDEIESKKGSIETQLIQKLDKVNADLAENVEPSQETLTGLKEMKKEMNAVPGEYKDKMNALVDKVNKILTDEQKNILATYKSEGMQENRGQKEGRPGKGDKAGPPQRDKANKEGKKFNKLQKALVTVRETPENEYKQKKDEVLAKLAAIMGNKCSWSEVQKKVAKVSQIMDKTRSLSNDEFEAQRESICNELVSVVMGNKKQGNKKIMRLMLNPDLIPVLEKRI